MKKYKIDNYIVHAASPLDAMKAVQTLKDSGYYWNDIRTMCIKNDWYTYGTNREYNNLFEKATSGQWKAEQIAQDIATHSRPDVRYEDVLREVKRLHVYDSKVKDEAFDRQTIEALIADEQAAIDSYNVAIANLKGKLSDEAIKVLQAIRDDEQNHVANLNAILSNNITEKNLEDSIKDDRLSPSTYAALKKLGVSKAQYQNWSQAQASKFIASRKQVSEHKLKSTTQMNKAEQEAYAKKKHIEHFEPTKQIDWLADIDKNDAERLVKLSEQYNVKSGKLKTNEWGGPYSHGLELDGKAGDIYALLKDFYSHADKYDDEDDFMTENDFYDYVYDEYK